MGVQDSVFPEGKPNFVGNFTRGYRIPGSCRFPVGHRLELQGKLH